MKDNDSKQSKQNEYEINRHKLVLERISSARNIKELPDITLSSLAKFLADNVYFDKKHLSSKEFKPFIIKMMDNGMVLDDDDCKICFVSILKRNYPNHTEKEFEEMFSKIMSTGRIYNMFIEMTSRGQKIHDLQEEIELEKHKQNMDDLKHAITIKELESVNIIDLESLVKKDTKNEIIDNIPKSKLSNLIYLIYQKKDYKEIDLEIDKICKSYNLSDEDYYIMYNQVLAGIVFDKKINYVVDELKLKEKQAKTIYKNEHLCILEKIAEALELSQLPKGINVNKLCRYLEANSKIANSSQVIKANQFNNYAEILISGKSVNHKLAKDELKKIVLKQNYNDSKKSYELLQERFSSLYRISYFAEEISLCRKRKKEFADGSWVDVELFIVPTPNTPEHGGTHYTLFKNEVSNLDLNSLIDNYASIDELVEKVQQTHPSFKAVGGIILSPKDRINLPGGNIKLYNKGSNEVTIENSRLAKIEELTKKQNKLLELQAEDKALFDERQKMTSSKLREIQQELLSLTSEEDEISHTKKRGSKNES